MNQDGVASVFFDGAILYLTDSTASQDPCS